VLPYLFRKVLLFARLIFPGSLSDTYYELIHETVFMRAMIFMLSVYLITFLPKIFKDEI